MVLKIKDYHLSGTFDSTVFALQVDHTHDEKSTAALYEGLWKMLEMLT